MVFRELRRGRVKDKDEPMVIVEPLGPMSDVGNHRPEPGLCNQARKARRAQNWDEAELILFNLKRLYPSTPLYSYSSAQVTRYRPEPVGPRWDGVGVFDGK
jgi:adenylate cyclase